MVFFAASFSSRPASFRFSAMSAFTRASSSATVPLAVEVVRRLVVEAALVDFVPAGRPGRRAALAGDASDAVVSVNSSPSLKRLLDYSKTIAAGTIRMAAWAVGRQ